jgi:hypothetical protein
MRRGLFFVAVLSMVLAGAGKTFADPIINSYFGYNQWGGTWHDVNKSTDSSGVDLMCWAATASNILDWGAYDTPAYTNDQAIYDNFLAHWENQGSLAFIGFEWWLNGTVPSDYPNHPTYWGGSAA